MGAMIVKKNSFWDGKSIKREHSSLYIQILSTNYSNSRRTSINYDFISKDDSNIFRFSIEKHKYNNENHIESINKKLLPSLSNQIKNKITFLLSSNKAYT